MIITGSSTPHATPAGVLNKAQKFAISNLEVHSRRCAYFTGISTISWLEAQCLCEEAILVRPLFDSVRAVSFIAEMGQGDRSTPLLRRLASAVACLLVDADQKRVGVVCLQVLQGRRVLERMERYDAIVIC